MNNKRTDTVTTTYVNWGEAKIKLTWEPEKQLPDRDLITSVHGFCFHEGNLLLVNLKDRGWDFPGGHIEPTKSAIECFKRETMEEAYVTGECKLLGYIVVDHSENEKWNEHSPYPKIGYQVFYRMNVEKLYDFDAGYESKERIFISPGEVANYYKDWNGLYQEVLDCAIRIK